MGKVPKVRPSVPPVGYASSLDEAWAAHLAPKAKDAPTVVSLFGGCGGSSLGYSMAGYKEVLAVEWDAKACITFRANFPGVPVWDGDIHALTGPKAQALMGVAKGELDVLDGSPPCQGFSTAGKRVFDDGRNFLFREYVRLLRSLKPKTFVVENVSGLVKGKMRLIFTEILTDLKRCGYNVSARLMNAKWFGVPQSRSRIIFIGVRKDLGIAPSHPSAQHGTVSLGEALGMDGYLVRDLGRSSGEMPLSEPSPCIGTFTVGDTYRQRSKLQVTAPFRRGDYNLAAKNELFENDWRDGNLESPTITANRPPMVRAVGGGWMKGVEWGMDLPLGAALPTKPPNLVVHRGMGFDESTREVTEPSYTIQAGSPPAWRDADTGIEVRPMTEMECARVQSFPPGFIWPVRGEAAYKQIGNAVPPLFMRAIAAHIRREILRR